MTVNLGPVFPTLAEPEAVPQAGNSLNYNPHCLKRDVSQWYPASGTKTATSPR